MPTAVSLAAKDHIVPSMSVMRVLQFENRRRKGLREQTRGLGATRNNASYSTFGKMATAELTPGSPEKDSSDQAYFSSLKHTNLHQFCLINHDFVFKLEQNQ